MKVPTIIAGGHVLVSFTLLALGSYWWPKNTHLFDVGHFLVPHVPFAGIIVHTSTILSPLLILVTQSPHKALRVGLRYWCIAWGFRTLTMCTTLLPPLSPPTKSALQSVFLGGDYDFLFSGHSIFFAAWVLASRSSLPTWACWGLGVLHASAILAARMHYTADIVVAWMIVCSLAWQHVDQTPVRVALCPPRDRPALRQLRHDVYAIELQQYTGPTEEYAPIVIGLYDEARVIGYIALTPPGVPKKTLYFQQGQWEKAWEVRALTIQKAYRKRGLGRLLIFSAARYIQLAGGDTMVAAARKELLHFYQSHGFKSFCHEFKIGSVTFIPGLFDIKDIQYPVLDSQCYFDARVRWDLPFPIQDVPRCPHGNGSTESFPVSKQNGVRADVLDAWFDPSPRVLDTIAHHTSSLEMRTTPPSVAQPLVKKIAEIRGVLGDNVVVGAGSSDLMYRCFPLWLTKASRVLLATPTYGEYPHIVKHVIRCQVTEVSFRDLRGLAEKAKDYDLLILVNPNSPTGVYSSGLQSVLENVPASTRIWVDETYIDYVGSSFSLEHFAAKSPNVVVCKSMSKVYALSGMRVAYLCGSPLQIQTIRHYTPPWILGRAVIAAAIAALEDVDYYKERFAQTHAFRKKLTMEVNKLGFEVEKGACANFILCKVPNGVDATKLIERMKRNKVFVRDGCGVPGMLRITVLSEEENALVVNALQQSLVMMQSEV